MPPPETFVYIKTHHSTIPNYVCVDKIPANFHPPPPTSTARKPVKTANVLFYWLTRPPASPPPLFDLLDASDVEIGFWPDFGRRIPPPPSMPPHLPTLAHPPTC